MKDKIRHYMKKAIQEAEKARGMCSPNPFVGAIIVKKERIIGKGHTQSYGSEHAEIMALNQAKGQARGAEMYVTLEPCSHYGKTPPCTDAIIKAGIKKVFIGLRDPNPLVNPKPEAPSPGIVNMREAGIEVSWGYMESAISHQLEYYICRIHKNRPFLILKSALSLDGKFAAKDGSSRWISSPESREKVHQMREQTDLILVGISTVLADDPLLTSRLPDPRRQPHRAVLDANLELPPGSQLVASLSQAPLILFHKEKLDHKQQTKAEILKELGVRLVPIPAQNGHLDLRAMLKHLHQMGHYSVLLESGGQLAAAFITQNLVDKYIFFYGAKILGGMNCALGSLEFPDIDHALELDIKSVQKTGADLMLIAYPKN